MLWKLNKVSTVYINNCLLLLLPLTETAPKLMLWPLRTGAVSTSQYLIDLSGEEDRRRMLSCVGEAGTDGSGMDEVAQG